MHLPNVRRRASAPNLKTVIVASTLLLSGGLFVVSQQSARATNKLGASPHIMLVMLENKGYSAVMGSPSAPFINSLAMQYATATNWYGIRHPSLPNYLAITTGSTQGVTSDCNTCGPFGPSLGGQLSAAGIPWKAYMESMPGTCSLGDSGSYVQHHDPFVYESDVLGSSCGQHVVPFTSFTTDLAGSNPPAFVWVTPNKNNDMHSGSVATGDAWIQANIGPVLTSPWFTGSPSTLIITMDENDAAPGGSCCGDAAGGQIPMVIVSSASQGVGTFPTSGDQYGTLRSIEEAYGLPLLGAARNTSDGDVLSLFSTAGSPTPGPTPTPSTSPTPPVSPPPTPTPGGGTFPVTAYGALCDGVHDDLTAIQAALDAAAAGHGNTVTVPAGTCLVSGHLKMRGANPVTLTGVSRDVSTLEETGGSNLLGAKVDGSIVENLTLDSHTVQTAGTAFGTAANNTELLHVTLLGGPNIFTAYYTGKTITQPATGNIVSDVIDVDQKCDDGFSFSFQTLGLITNFSETGTRLAIYKDSYVTVTGMDYTAGTCAANGYYITAPSSYITIDGFTSDGSGGIIGRPTPQGSNSNITINNEVLTGTGVLNVHDVTGLLIENSNFGSDENVVFSPLSNAIDGVYAGNTPSTVDCNGAAPTNVAGAVCSP